MKSVGQAVLGMATAVDTAEIALAMMPAHKKALAGREFGAVVAALLAIREAQWAIAGELARLGRAERGE